MINLGSYALGDAVDILFSTSAADGGRENFSATLEEADIIVVKDGAVMTLDASTITITDPFNSDAGIQKISIDLSNDADFAYGSKYWVYIHPDETIDTQSVAGVLGFFSIDVPVKVQGTFSGTHTSTTSDLGANAPANDITGMTLYNPTDEESRVVESYNTTTGVATHAAWDTGAGVTDGEPWVLLPTAPIDAATLASINAEVDTALADIHLDHLLATDYDPASKPGTATALLNELVENDAGTSRFTVNALENGPSGSGASAEAIADAVLDEALSGHTTAGTLGKAIADIEVDATAILADTHELQTDDVPGLIAALNDPTANDIRNAITGGAYALDTDANGRIRLVVGTAAGEVTLSGGIIAADIQEVDGNAISDGGSAPAGGGYGET